MAEIRIAPTTRKSFVKDVKPGPGIVRKRIPATTVKGHMTPDKGKPGRTPAIQRVIKLNPETHSGFKKEYSIEKNADIVQRKSGLHKGIQQLNSLAILSTDRETASKARAAQKILSARLRASK